MRNTLSVYRSKVDGWLAAVLVFSMGITVAVAMLLLFSGSRQGILFGIVYLAIIAGVALVVIPVRYRITDEELVIQSGLLRWRIPLSQILRLARSGSLSAGPALSLDRLEVEYAKGRSSRSTILISPERQQEFIRDLAVAAGLKPRDEAWVR